MSESLEGTAFQRYCCGCGGPLLTHGSARFHPDCLRRDKRRRVTEQRRREEGRRQAWLKRQHCPACGASLSKLSDATSERAVENACEPSQRPQANANPPVRRESRQRPTVLADRL